MMSMKELTLERKREPGGQLGSFGFSVLGGAGTKFPAVVCDLDQDGPAFQSEQVLVGDLLMELNGEELSELPPSELVQRIRTAPSPSSFVLGEDEEIRQQVVAFLRRQERRALVRQKEKTGGPFAVKAGEHKTHQLRKTSAPTLITTAEERDRHQKRRIIVVEPSVNKKDTNAGEAVQVIDNKIVGRIERGGEDSSELVPGPESSSPKSSPRKSPVLVRNGHHPSPPHLESAAVQNHQDDLFIHRGSNLSPRTSAGSADCTGSIEERTSAACAGAAVVTGHTEHTLSGQQRDSDPLSPLMHVSVEAQDVSLQEPWLVKSGSSDGASTASVSMANTQVTTGGEEFVQDKTRLLSPVREQRSSSEPPTSPSSDSSPSPHPLEHPTGAIHQRGHKQRGSSSRRSDPYSDAIILARRLYMLDGFKKSDIAQRLSDPSEFGCAVGREYLKFFEFDGLDLDEALRNFISAFSLTGESQERERVMIHFSERYLECNQEVFPSQDAVHGLTVALLLLNTDLHADHGGHRMSFSQFVSNIQGMDIKYSKDMLKRLYESIKKHPLLWAVDDEQQFVSQNHSGDERFDEPVRTFHVTIPGTFVEVELPEDTPVFKEGQIQKKNIMEGPHKKVSRGKRTWKPYYAHLKGFLLYFAPPQGELHLDDTSSAVTVTHCLAMKASDYSKKAAVLRVTTSDWHSFLLQAIDITDMQQWIGAINTAAATYSSPPLAAPISSSSGFQRPTFPIAPTKDDKEQQIENHQAKVNALDTECREHQAYKPKGKKAKHTKLQDWFDKYEYLIYETQRFTIYLASLTGRAVDYNAPLPSGLVPSPSISTLATPGATADGFGLSDDRLLGGTSSHSPMLGQRRID